MNATIAQGTIEQAMEIERQIPEFDTPHRRAEYERRLSGTNPLILIAEIDGANAGYKVGYDRHHNGTYYSWVGGVLPEFRGLKLASALANEQERWATAQGYKSIILKTKPHFDTMIGFAHKRGFVLINVDYEHGREMLVLEKKLI